MHQVFFLGRIYPYWALPLAAVLGQLAVHFKRRRQSRTHFTLWMATGVLAATAVAWIVFRGDIYSDNWVRVFFDS